MNGRHDPSYHGRERYAGVRIAPEWQRPHGFAAFLAHVGRKPTPQHTLDRIDPRGHYEPGNVRRATPTEQARNRRNGRTLTIGGVTRPVIEWCNDLDLNYYTVLGRLKRGVPHELCILAEPLPNPTHAVGFKRPRRVA